MRGPNPSCSLMRSDRRQVVSACFPSGRRLSYRMRSSQQVVGHRVRGFGLLVAAQLGYLVGGAGRIALCPARRASLTCSFVSCKNSSA